jgi:hypothetical protein
MNSTSSILIIPTAKFFEPTSRLTMPAVSAHGVAVVREASDQHVDSQHTKAARTKTGATAAVEATAATSRRF